MIGVLWVDYSNTMKKLIKTWISLTQMVMLGILNLQTTELLLLLQHLEQRVVVAVG